MKRLWFQKNRIVKSLGIITMLIVFLVGTTYAYNQHGTQQENLLRASKVAGEIIENENSVEEKNQFLLVKGGTTKKEVQFKNIGASAVFVRVSFGETWLDGNGEWLTGDNEYATLYWSQEWKDEWQLGDDNWYYYKKVLEPDELTAKVISAVGFEAHEELPLEYQDASYQLFFTMEVVQCSDDKAVNDKALEKLFNRSATITNSVITWE